MKLYIYSGKQGLAHKEKGFFLEVRLKTSRLFSVMCRYQQSATLHLCRKEACPQYNATAVLDLYRNTGKQSS